MIDHDCDFWPTMEEADYILRTNKHFRAQEQESLDAIKYVGEDLTGTTVICQNCQEYFYSQDSVFEKLDSITQMKCPKCLVAFKEIQNAE